MGRIGDDLDQAAEDFLSGAPLRAPTEPTQYPAISYQLHPIRMTRIATWNVNSIKARVHVVLLWLKAEKPDLLLMQETKCIDDEFPRGEFESLGYHVEAAGQKSYNGVAILSRSPLRVERRRLPDAPEDDEARYIEAVVEPSARNRRVRQTLRVASLYSPSGNPAGSESFAYKLDWMKRLVRHARRLVKEKEALVLGGDFNVAPTDADVYDAFLWGNDALCRPETRTQFRKLLKLGFADVIAARHPGPGNYTFWDYQGRAWAKNLGWRIVLLSPLALSRLGDCGIDKKVRGLEKPSDHVPVWCELKM
jgi:exodeoxyribonuclease III